MKHWPKALLATVLLASPASAAPTVTEFPIPTAAALPQDIVLGPDGKLWFSEKDADKIGRVTPGNPPVIQEFDVPSGLTDPIDIAVGPDNKIWFNGTVMGAAAAGRMNPANPADTQEFHGFGLNGPRGIGAGPDGSIWLGGFGAVVRIDPATGMEESVSDIPLNGGNFNTRGLTGGPDGNVWMTDFAGQIARVTPAGVVTLFDIPGDGAWDIVTGPDGNLWYTAPFGNDSTVGKITTAGAFTPFPVTDAGDQLGITVGPDGALWFAQAVANNIGRMTTSGQFTTLGGVTAAGRPEYMAPGPANTLWFTEKDGNRIGRITGIVDQQQPQSPDVTKPDVTRFRITRKRFRVGGLGTVIRWTQSEDATVTISFERRVRGRLRRVRNRRMRFASSAGKHALRFRGRVDLKHPLKPGRYRMTLSARDAAANVSAPDRVRFTLLRKKRPRR
jgi:virginiamycin B lyase